MSYCECCEFDAPNHSRYLKHLGTKKHAKRYLEAIKLMENPNQNIVFSQTSKKRVQEKQNKRNRKRCQKKKLDENVQENEQNEGLDENVQENEQNEGLDENVQEITDFVFLDTHFLDLYKTISTPLNPTFSWIMWIFMIMNTFFHPFQKKRKKGLNGK